MSHIVNLKPADRKLLLEALAASMEFKYKKLRNPESIRLMERNYEEWAQKIATHPIEIHNAKNNSMTWFQDQLKHSGIFWGTKLSNQAYDLAQQVIDNTYDHYAKISVFQDLFKDD